MQFVVSSTSFSRATGYPMVNLCELLEDAHPSEGLEGGEIGEK